MAWLDPMSNNDRKEMETIVSNPGSTKYKEVVGHGFINGTFSLLGLGLAIWVGSEALAGEWDGWWLILAAAVVSEVGTYVDRKRVVEVIRRPLEGGK